MDTVWTRPGGNQANSRDTARHHTDMCPQFSGIVPALVTMPRNGPRQECYLYVEDGAKAS